MKIIIYIFLSLYILTLNAETVLLNWAKPSTEVHRSQAQREFGGVTIYKDKILVAYNSGHFRVFSQKGKLQYEKQYAGYFSLPPIVHDNHIYLINSEKLIKLTTDYKTVWDASGKSPVISKPLFSKEGIWIQYYDNTVYLLNNKDGSIKANYSYYAEIPLSYIRLSGPFSYSDKVVFGFSNGQVTFFKHTNNAQKGTDDIVPYYKFSTGKQSIVSDGRIFNDVMSMLPFENGIVFSNGERGGLIAGGKVVEKKELRNLFLEKYGDKEVLAYGERGIHIFDSAANLKKTVLKTDSFISGHVKTDNYHIFTEIGSRRYMFQKADDAKVFIFNNNLDQLITSFSIPTGVAGSGAFFNNSFYFLSNKGILYSFTIINNHK